MASKKIIAVVDDDVAIREAMDDLLRSLGYECRTYSSAETFLSTRTSRIKCIFLDVRMNGMSGLELQRQLVLAGDDTPIIFMSSYCDPKTTKLALSNGARAFLPKPVDFDALLVELEAALG